jgi:phosphonate transport system permease protein
MSEKIEMVHRKSLLSPLPAVILTLLVPGLGQSLSGYLRRGLLLLVSLGSIILLALWKFSDLGRLKEGSLQVLGEAVRREPLFALFTIAAILVIWIWIAADAGTCAASGNTREGSFLFKNGIFVLILISFFSFGWQISEIDLGRLTRDANEAWAPLSKILWPWEAATTRAVDTVEAAASIIIEERGDEEAPAPPVKEEGEPWIQSTPNIGKLSKLGENSEIIPGTLITIEGENFEPDTRTEIWWQDAIGNEFRPRHDGSYVATRSDAEGSFRVELVMPYRLVPPSAKGVQEHIVMARQTSDVGPLLPSEPLKLTLELIIETIFMGMMATLFGIVFSIPISFLAARNLMSTSRFTLAIYYLTRTILNIVRAIEPLIWALIAVVWVGLGPFAGIVALTIHSIAALGKLYSEAIEGINPGPIEAIQATGATKLQTIMFAVIPQMIPPFVSFSIYRWDINVRMSTVIGMVGGGGIGFLLVQYIRLLEYRSAGIAVWFIAVTVAILDYVSAEIRQKFV